MQNPGYFLIEYTEIIGVLQRAGKDQDEWSTSTQSDAFAGEEDVAEEPLMVRVPSAASSRARGGRQQSRRSRQGLKFPIPKRQGQANDAMNNKLRQENQLLRQDLAEATKAISSATGATVSAPGSQPASDSLCQQLLPIFNKYGLDRVTPQQMLKILSSIVTEEEAASLVTAHCSARRCHPDTGRIDVSEWMEWLRCD